MFCFCKLSQHRPFALPQALESSRSMSSTTCHCYQWAAHRLQLSRGASIAKVQRFGSCVRSWKMYDDLTRVLGAGQAAVIPFVSLVYPAPLSSQKA